MDSPYRNELLVAIGAVQQAVAISRAVLSVADKGVVEKDDLSPVTVADFAIQALLTATIHNAFPSDRFVGEETAADLRSDPVLLDRVWELLQGASRDGKAGAGTCEVPDTKDQVCEMIDWCGLGLPTASREGSERVWVFDPIDGTKTFVRGEAYAVNIALLEGSRQVLSVVACPTISEDAEAPVANDTIDPTGRGCILFAVQGHGAYVRPLPGSPSELEARRLPRHATAVTSTEQLRSVTCFNLLDSGVDVVHKTITDRLGVPFPGCDLLGWVPRWAVLALGLANMTVWVYKTRERHAKIWDHAGAILLFEEVGGKVTDVDGREIDWTAGRKLKSNFGFLAAPPSLHETVLKTVHETLKEVGKASLLAHS